MPSESSLQPSASSAHPRSVVIGTAGHIDHGKTSLIRALTGIDTDRLPEEKRRGITVDLGFASLDIESGTLALRLSFIDVPGHALFVHNMLAGAGGIDAVMLIISAEEGVKPQTEEHLAICTMLGIERGLAVITKTDAVSKERLADVRNGIEQFLSNTILDPRRSPIISVSARSGVGVEDLRRELVSLSKRIPSRDNDALPRLPVDRAFVMKGFGTVVTGTLIAGTLKTGQTIAIEPKTRAARIRGIQVHGRATESAHAGSRVAVNLAGIEASELGRGDTLVQASTMIAADTIDAEVSLLPGATALKHRVRVHFHAFAAECMATVSLYEYQPVEPGCSRLVRLRLSKSIILLPGDRFVMRQGTPISTIGGGRVLDAHPIQRLRKAACHAWLQDIQQASRGRQVALRVARRWTSGLTLSVLSVETGIGLEAIRKLVEPQLEEKKLLYVSPDFVLTGDALDHCARVITAAVETRIKENYALGVKRSELRSHIDLGAEVFDFVLRRLEHEKKLRIQDELVVPFELDNSDGPDRAQLSHLSAAYETAGLAVPSPEELAVNMGIEPTEMRRLITILLRDKTLVRLGSDNLCVHQKVLADLTLRIQTLHGQEVDIARFKELTGLSRKYAIPLLEYFDRERITRKQHDHRIVL